VLLDEERGSKEIKLMWLIWWAQVWQEGVERGIEDVHYYCWDCSLLCLKEIRGNEVVDFRALMAYFEPRLCVDGGLSNSKLVFDLSSNY
jgi:hypothetical protein